MDSNHDKVIQSHLVHDGCAIVATFSGFRVIFNDELNRSAEHATRFVHFFSSELRALNFVATCFSTGSGERSYHADFEGLCGAPETDEHDHEAGQNDPVVNYPFQHV